MRDLSEFALPTAASLVLSNGRDFSEFARDSSEFALPTAAAPLLGTNGQPAEEEEAGYGGGAEVLLRECTKYNADTYIWRGLVGSSIEV